MKKRHFLVLILLMAALPLVRAQKLPKDFRELLEVAELEFTPPEGEFKSVKPRENMDMLYEYALLNKEKGLEIRFAIRPMDTMMARISSEMPQLKESILLTVMMNCSQMGNPPEYMAFPDEAVREEFNADWGATATFETLGEFGEGYNYCMLYAIHRAGIADAYVFYMSEDIETILNEVFSTKQDWFHLLRFKD